jgi:hypothetical protein
MPMAMPSSSGLRKTVKMKNSSALKMHTKIPKVEKTCLLYRRRDHTALSTREKTALKTRGAYRAVSPHIAGSVPKSHMKSISLGSIVDEEGAKSAST